MNSCLRGKALRRCRGLAALAVATLIAFSMTRYIISVPQGLPASGAHHPALSYEGLLLAIAANIARHGLCNTWWCGFVDPLRFSPPTITLALIPWFPSVEHAAYAFTVLMAVSLTGLYASLGLAVYRLSSSLTLSIASMLSLPLLAGFREMVVLRDVPMMLGLCIALVALLKFIEVLRMGERRSAIACGALFGLTALTDLRAFVFLLVVSAVLGVYTLLDLIKHGADRYALAYLLRRVVDVVLLCGAICCWWLIPALLPFGARHCLSLSMRVTAVELSSAVPFIALSTLLATCFVARARLATVALATTLATIVASVRYYPDTTSFIALAVSLATLFTECRRGYANRIASACVLVLMIVLSSLYTASLSQSLRNCIDFGKWPQYQVAEYLRKHCGYGCRALVLDTVDRWWIQLFDAETAFVSAPSPSLCILARFSKLPSMLVERGLSAVSELRALCVEYIVAELRSLQSPTLSKLIAEHVLKPVARFGDLVVVKVSGVECRCVPPRLGVWSCITPSKMVGAAVSALCIALYVYRSRRERILETLGAPRAR